MKKRAFSLVEVLIALLILMIGILGALKLNIAGLFSVKKSMAISKNVFLSQSFAENALVVPFDDLESFCEDLSGYYNYSGDTFYVNCFLVNYSEHLKEIMLRVYNKENTVFSLSVFRAREEW